jgi:polyhydroxybutyrate depolymerase
MNGFTTGGGGGDGGGSGGGGSGGGGGGGGGLTDALPVWSDAQASSDGCNKTAPAAPSMIGTTQYGRFALTVSGVATDATDRLYYVRLPDNYDPSRAYRVIYLGPGCGPAQDLATTPKALPMDRDPGSTASTTDAILVQMEQGFYNPADYNSKTCVPGVPDGGVGACAYCFDDWAFKTTIPTDVAIEKAYFDQLHKTIEANYCVDKNRQFYAGYSSGGWLAQQLGCWFPDVLRAQGNVTGGLPPPIKANVDSTNDYCSTHPIAAFLIHNNPDQSNAFSGSRDAAARLFKLNGCSGSFVEPPLPNSTAALPAGLAEYSITGVTNGPAFRCYRYTSCPADYPMVFCVSTDSNHGDQHARADPGFWEFFSKF